MQKMKVKKIIQISKKSDIYDSNAFYDVAILNSYRNFFFYVYKYFFLVCKDINFNQHYLGMTSLPARRIRESNSTTHAVQ